MPEPRQALHGLLLRELRAAVTARIEGRADPRQVTADLEQRLRWIDASRQGAPTPADQHPERTGETFADPAPLGDGMSRGSTEYTVLWLCPFSGGIDPPELLRPNVRTIAQHSDHGVSSWLETVGELRVDAVVIDVSVVRGHNYDPAVIAELLVARCTQPPRYLIAVVKRGSDDPIWSQYAFAHEIHLLWGRLPRLVIEEGVLYYLESAPPMKKDSADGHSIADTHKRVGQTRRWSEIASRSAAFVTGEVTPEPVDYSHPAIALVLAMCDRRRGASHFRLSPAQRSVLIALADGRPDVHQLVGTTGYALNAVRSALRGIAYGLNPDPALAPTRERQERAMSFCDELAKHYAPWLRSLERRGRVP